MMRSLLLAAACCCVAGCATRATTRLSAALDYVRAIEGTDVPGFQRAVEREGFEYVAPLRNQPRQPLSLKYDDLEQALQSLSQHGRPSFSSVRFSSKNDDFVQVAFEVEVSSRTGKVEDGGLFTITSVWRLTVEESAGVFRVTRVEEVPPRGNQRLATFAQVATLHAGRSRPIAPGGCAPAPCDGTEHLDSAGRVIVKKVWPITGEGEPSKPPEVRDSNGQRFGNFKPRR